MAHLEKVGLFGFPFFENVPEKTPRDECNGQSGRRAEPGGRTLRPYAGFGRGRKILRSGAPSLVGQRRPAYGSGFPEVGYRSTTVVQRFCKP